MQSGASEMLNGCFFISRRPYFSPDSCRIMADFHFLLWEKPLLWDRRIDHKFMSIWESVCPPWRFVYLLLFVCLCVAALLNPVGFLTAGANTDVYVWRLPIAAILGRYSLSWNMTTVKAKTRSTKARRLRFFVFFSRQCDTWNFFLRLPGWRVCLANRETPQVKCRRAVHRYKALIIMVLFM